MAVHRGGGSDGAGGALRRAERNVLTKKKRLLIVDDDPDILYSLEMILGERYDVVVAQNGAEALPLADGKTDVVLLDLMMPVMDGVTFVRQMRELGQDTPVVLLSAGIDVKKVAATIGAAAWCPKPCPIERIESAIEKALESSGGGGNGGERDEGHDDPSDDDTGGHYSSPFEQAFLLVRRRFFPALHA